MQTTMKSLAIKADVGTRWFQNHVNTLLWTYISRWLLAILLICGLGIIPVIAQQVAVVELDTKILQLQTTGDKNEAESLRKLYYDMNPTVFVKADNSNPVIVGKGKAKVANITVSKLRGVSGVDLSAVKLLIINFNGTQIGGYQFRQTDLSNFPSLEYVVVLSDTAISASNVQMMFLDTDEDTPFTILYKSLSEKY